MGLDDLLRDRQPQPGILAETLMRPVGVKALEDPLQRILANSRPTFIMRIFNFRSPRRQTMRTLPAGPRKRDWRYQAGWRITWPSRESWPGTEKVSARPRPSKRHSTAMSLPSLVSLATEVRVV